MGRVVGARVRRYTPSATTCQTRHPSSGPNIEELLTAAHDIMHGLRERVTPAHDPERLAVEVANTTNTPDTRSPVKNVMLRIATGCRADCVQAAGGEQTKQERVQKRDPVREQR